MDSHNKPPADQGYTGDTVPMRTPPARPAPERAAPRQPRQAGQSRSGDRARAPRSAQTRVPTRPRRSTVQPSLPPLRLPRTSGWSWLRRIALLLGIVAVLLIIGAVVMQQRIARQIVVNDVRSNPPFSGALLAPMNILLLGVDLREGYPDEGVRSDTLVVLHVDPVAGWANMLSVPRDTLATIPDLGERKINAAFGHGYDQAAAIYGDGTAPIEGGAALAAETMEQFLGLGSGQRINYVATINFNGFAAIIDALGGVDVDVPFEIVDDAYPTEDFGTITIRIPAGRQRMDGTTALQYVRTRHADSDFGRAQRQQQVIAAIAQQLRATPALQRPFVLMRVADAASGAIETTFPAGRLDALPLVLALSRLDAGAIGQLRISPDDVAVTEIGSDLVWDRDGVRAQVQALYAPPGETAEQATIQVLNGAGVSGLAGSLSQRLAAEQFTVVTPGDLDATSQSRIVDYGDHPRTIARLRESLGDIPVARASSADAPGSATIVIELGADYEQWLTPPP